MPISAGSAHFLGLELSTEQLRATIVDEHLELVGVECVDFDSELPEYQTQGGIFTTPGDAYMTPVDMWVRALDMLMQKLHDNFDLAKVKSIGGAAQSACVWWKAGPLSPLANLSPAQPLHAQIGPAAFALPHTPIAQDTSTLAHSQALEIALGGPDMMAARVGTSANASLTAAHAMKIREIHPDVWARTARVTLASAFLCSLLLGSWAPLSESEACASGMWSHMSRQWDERVLEVVAGSKDEGLRLRRMLGEVETTGGGRPIGTISSYFVERYGFERDTFLTSFTSDYLSTYLSLCPSPTDSLISFGPMDMLLTAAPHYMPTRMYNVYPHPAQDSSEKRRYIAALVSRNGDVPRALVRDMYTKSWSAFDRLVAIVPPGGSIGLDDKLFSFWILQGDGHPFSHVKGIFRFETGVKVNEFRDLRANPRCLLESQILSLRTRYAHMISSHLFYPPPRARPNPNTRGGPLTFGPTSSLGVSFDPYDITQLPRRILTTGAAANFPSMVNLLTDVFNAPVYMPATQLESAQVSPHRNAPAPGVPSRAALGGAYIARWAWGRAGRPEERYNSFEDEVRRLLGKRWIANGGGSLRVASTANSSQSTTPPYMHRSGLGAMVLAEEEEDKAAELERLAAAAVFGIPASSSNINGYDGMGGHTILDDPTLMNPSRLRTVTGSSGGSMATTSTTSAHASTAFTTPDMNTNTNGTPLTSSATVGTAAYTPTPLSPTVAIPTADAEAQLGLAKVAEPDLDSFMTYAAIVPEYCRLESLLVKSLV